MKTAAVIAEYNPFHNGHQYQLMQTRLLTDADYILVVMSGDFVQRGAPACANKYCRTKMALSCGADVVIELPALYALASAEFFAGGAITLLNNLNVIDFLSFGSEHGEIQLFEKCAQILINTEKETDGQLKTLLKEGYSYPAARLSTISDKSFSSLFTSPNNILGLEYCKTLLATHSSIRPFTLKRQDSGYHNRFLNADASRHVSASAIRKALSENPEKIVEYVPQMVYQIMKENHLLTLPVTENTFSDMLYYKLLMEKEQGFTDYLDCTPALSDKICKQLPRFTGFTDFARLLKSKDLTYTRISRVLMHILLDIKTPSYFLPDLTKRNLALPYARLLGFRQSAAPLLSAIKKKSKVPVISKISRGHLLLSDTDNELLSQDIRCACIYESVMPRLPGEPMLNELTQSPVILP